MMTIKMREPMKHKKCIFLWKQEKTVAPWLKHDKKEEKKSQIHPHTQIAK